MSNLAQIIDNVGVFFISRLLYLRTINKFKLHYGDFTINKNYDRYRLNNLSNETTFLYGEIVKIILDLPINPKKVLLVGENNTVKNEIKKGIEKLNKSQIVTTGLAGPKKVDYQWDFEKDPPRLGKFSLIISQSIIEHLINPYKHLSDLTSFLEKNGYLVVQTVLPGFGYHRFPVDTMRFYPDWFEEIAKRRCLNLKVVKKYITNNIIFYLYQKT